MGKSFEQLLPEHEAFIRRQRMFFVASAPLGAEGHVNLSPKGYDSLRLLSPNEAAYLDLTGSGNETSAHLLENGRITFMFVAFEGPPQIIRLYAKGRVVLPGDPDWDGLADRFERLPGMRQIIHAQIHAVKTSCGYSVPYFSYEGERDTLIKWAQQRDDGRLADYRREKNSRSMDGLDTPLGLRLGSG